MIDPITYFLVALKGSLFSTGGLGNLPSLHQDLVSRHWATDRQFASAIAIGQLAPGPTGLWVVALGYLTAGFAGAMLMTIAVIIPPLLVIPLSRLHSRLGHLVLVRGFNRGLTLGIAGAVPAIVIFRVLGAYGYTLPSILVLLASLALLMTGRVPPVGVLTLGAIAGIVLFRI
jgi:chromate transporter